MRVLVTGANGFLGRAVVRALRRSGHTPIALVRPATDVDALGWSPEVEVRWGDLRQPQHVEALADVEAVIHAAAGTSGELPSQIASSVVSTESLFELLRGGDVRRFVHVSSFSVYDFATPPVGAVISSTTTALETRPERRDAYTSAKLAQERLVRTLAQRLEFELVVVRPGVIFGPGNTWAWGRLARLGPIDLIAAPSASFRLVHVDNCASALVSAVSAPAAAGATVDLVDDELPTHLEFHRAAGVAGADTGLAVPVPWPLLRFGGRLVGALARLVAGRHPKLPEIASVARQEARWKPFRYDNAAAKAALAWSPDVDLRSAVQAAVRFENDLGSP